MKEVANFGQRLFFYCAQCDDDYSSGTTYWYGDWCAGLMTGVIGTGIQIDTFITKQLTFRNRFLIKKIHLGRHQLKKYDIIK